MQMEPEAFAEEDEQDGSRQRSQQTLKEMLKTTDVLASKRVEAVVKLYEWLREKFPDEKMVIFSMSSRFLDILGSALQQRFNVSCLRFDGTIPPIKREDIRMRFSQAHPKIPMLIQGDAGGVGLNLTEASISVQTEAWWNRNTELQAYARVNRQGQQKEVKLIRLEAINSAVESYSRSLDQENENDQQVIGPLGSKARRSPGHPIITSQFRLGAATHPRTWTSPT